MANNKTDFYKTVNEIISIAKERNVVHLYTDDNEINDSKIHIKGFSKSLINFGSCSYLGIENDKRLIEKGTQYLKKYGAQFSSSRTYVSLYPYQELEELIFKIFKQPIILSPNSTLGHMATIPAIIEDNDLLIFDHQAHISMHHASRLIDKNVKINLLRHSRLDELENKLEENKNNLGRVWYFIDGVYSMYGDVSPAKKIIELLNKYKQLHLYVDDAHGMSWRGKNGSGYFMSEINKHHPRMVLSTSLAKGFGSSGGVIVFPNDTMYNRVKLWGGPLTYSGPQQPATLGCSIASAQIHLSSEIIELQKKLMERIKYCNELMKHYNLPLVSEAEVPIKFIGVGLPKVGYNLVKRLMNDGLFTNLGVFPAVPENCTGIRFTITNKHSFEDIENLAKSINHNLPLALKEEGRSLDDIYKSFKSLRSRKTISNENINNQNKFEIHTYDTIQLIKKDDWNKYFSNTTFDHDALLLLEESFNDNLEKHNNWKFKYFRITDENGNDVLLTFSTIVYIKNDMFFSEKTSELIENKRLDFPEYQISRCVMLGSPLTEGDMLWINKENKNYLNALSLLIDNIKSIAENNNIDNIMLRDFKESDSDLNTSIIDAGFIKINIPPTSVLEIDNWGNENQYLEQLPSKKRNKVKKDIIAFRNSFIIEVKNDIPYSDVYYKLYLETASKSLRINTFKLPVKFFRLLHLNTNVDKIIIRHNEKPEEIIAVGYAYKTPHAYCPWVLGISKNEKIKGLYRNLLFTAILRAKELGCTRVLFGLTAEEEKNKLGATITPKIAYIQMKDNFEFNELDLIEKNHQVF